MSTKPANLGTLRKAVAQFDHTVWAQKCHAASLALVRSGLLPEGSRVARGTTTLGVHGQHSWVVVGDPLEPGHRIIDVTLWSYDPSVDGVHFDTTTSEQYLPKGAGSIWAWGQPRVGHGEPIKLQVDDEEARRFLGLLGPMDLHGWTNLAHAPLQGWPAKAILTAMDDHPVLHGLTPIDHLGHVTDLNPGNLYW